jgi:FKBP-type peptidyl-prolyl cis-trans isomerase
MQLVGEGGKIILYVPSELGYGANGAGNAIGPNSTLIFEVEMNKVFPATN